MKKVIKLTESDLRKIVTRILKEVSQKDFDEMGEPSAEMIKISFPLDNCMVHMVGFLKEEDGYFFIPMENGFSSSQCNEYNSRHIQKLKKTFNNLIDRKIRIDSGKRYFGKAISFNKKNYDVWIQPLLIGDDGVLFEKI